MGLIEGLFSFLFGGGRNVVKETVEVFRENAEKSGQREADLRAATLEQFAKEFLVPRKGIFDRAMDGLNRVPRPALAMGTLGLFVSAMVDPIWFASRMQGIALVPEPLWWLLGAIVSFYFGARHQTKNQDFQRSITETLMRAPEVRQNIGALMALNSGAGETGPEAPPKGAGPNPALEDWRQAE
ncbi:holin family protein [Psychromarinibacter sp. C21-152]|uniref:Holin family protein n=1 Tax=Psychromarinibacter sediminicola TaxID=3033385 RepID=A0AAE3T8K2_9RHOB|nr:holin family protein [Psychromarinibacter sediminicola]MDF0601342.1 holin family protein [Psychromarinibacter sediminicola]